MLAFFENNPDILAVMSTKDEGPLGRAGDKKQSKIYRARQRFFKEQGIKSKQVVAAELIHGNRVGVIQEPGVEIYPGTDGLVTDKPELALTVTAADCGAVFFRAPRGRAGRERAVGICHAGWRGIIAGVVMETGEKMKDLGASPGQMQVAIGPMIGGCCFEVGEEVASLFQDLGFKAETRRSRGRWRIDLKRVIERQLLESGIKAKNIFIHPDCTCCKGKEYLSYRRSKGKLPGVMVAAIKINEA